MCGSHREAWRRRCYGARTARALLVTLSVIYLEFKAHLTSMATTAFCSDTPSHLVCAQWYYHLFFNRPMPQNTPKSNLFIQPFLHQLIYQSAIQKPSLEEKLHQRAAAWSAASDDLASTIPDLNLIEMVWDELYRRVQEKQSTSAQRMWELLQDCWKNIPGGAD